MARHDDKLKEDRKHLTDRGLASYMRNEGKLAGNYYGNNHEIWNAPRERLQTGLLHLILDRLEQIEELARKNEEHKKPKPSPLDIHREFLNVHYPKVLKVSKKHAKERKRLIAMFGEDVDLGSDMDISFDIHDMAQYFRGNYFRGNREGYWVFKAIIMKVNRLKSVRKPEDVSNLHGIGKMRSMRILQQLRAKEQQNDNNHERQP